MKMMKTLFVFVVVMFVITAVPVFAFHSGSQLKCNNCHTMHYSEGGEIPSTANGYPQDADAGGPFEKLLIKANISDLCLECHKDNAYSGAPSVYNTAAGTGIQLPGGDFGYSAKGLSGNAMSANVGRGHSPAGDAAHPSVNFDLDVLNGSPDAITPPGGTSLASGEFVCTDCHGVHGPLSGSSRQYGYRMLLRTVNGNNTSNDSIFSIAWTADTTVTPTVFNLGPDGADLSQNESATNHPVYKGGFSNWCSSCHPNFHGADESDPDVGDGTDFIRHPTKTALGSYNSRYGSYSYQYPLIKVGGNWTRTDQGSGNVSASDEIMCLTCHRAHATPNPDSLRWDPSQASALSQCNQCHKFGGRI